MKIKENEQNNMNSRLNTIYAGHYNRTRIL